MLEMKVIKNRMVRQTANLPPAETNTAMRTPY